MNARCPAEYSDSEVIRKCERAFFPLEEEDFSIVVPVTNFKSGVHYANRYCATCHNDSSVAAWQLLVKCGIATNDHQNATGMETLSTLHFDKSLGTYALFVGDRATICEITSAEPENVDASNRCTKSFVISECPTVYDGPIPKECDQLRSNVLVCTASGYLYSNRECARCNNVSENSIVPCIQVPLPDSNVLFSPTLTQIVFKLRKGSHSCSVPAVAKFYC